MTLKWNEKKKLYQVIDYDCEVVFEHERLEECDDFIASLNWYE